jgi:hypothetical protein
MKFSDNTIQILNNFKTINPSMEFVPGKVLKTISPMKTIFARANIEEDIPGKAWVYDLTRFLAIHGLYESPEVEFGEKQFIISEGRTKTRYTYADASMILAPGDKDIKLPSVDVTMPMEWKTLEKVIKAAGVLQLPFIAFEGDGEICSLSAIDPENKGADNFSVAMGETSDTFSLVMKTENMRLLPMDYTVNLCAKGMSNFSSDTVEYFVAIESKHSSYKKGE